MFNVAVYASLVLLILGWTASLAGCLFGNFAVAIPGFILGFASLISLVVLLYSQHRKSPGFRGGA